MSPRDDAAFRQARDSGALYVPPETLTWDVTKAGAKAIVHLGGCPPKEFARLIVQAGRLASALNLSLIWNEDRVRGFDLQGPPHTNLRGLAIRPPHRQFYLPNGQWETEAVDCARMGVVDERSALRYFLNWCGLPSTDLWTDPPPLQRSYLGAAARAGRRGKSR